MEFTERYFTGLKEKIQITSQHFTLQYSASSLREHLHYCVIQGVLKSKKCHTSTSKKYFGFTVNKTSKYYCVKEYISYRMQ